jgi:AsmA family/AsmA-like C-terminal region
LKLLSSKRHWAIAAVVVLLLFLLRPGASPLKSRIIRSISSGVGRPVDIGSVHIRLLPWPGFNLENLVVYDDATFGAEPMLRAGEVTATLRLTSLLRGRLEIARLDMSEPSLNLVRGTDGHWNVETLLAHTAQVPLAPTAKARLEPRPGFPYIEGSSGRINFMVGREKKPYALTNADFSLWQESENTWGVRLKAQPTRTDLNLNDTGVLGVSGTWRRAAVLRETPLNFSVEWDRPQLGQLTKFLTGVDQGWRGAVQLGAVLTCTPARVVIASDAYIQDFRRYDITSGEALRLAAHCDALYSSIDRGFSDILCNAPVRDGVVTLKGAAGFPGSHKYDLLLNAERVPASALVRLMRRAKKNLPDDLVVQGTVQGSLKLERNAQASINRFEGRGEVENCRLVSSANHAEIAPETIPFVLTGGPTSSRFLETAKAFHKKLPSMGFGMGPQMVIGPFSLGVGKLIAGGWIDREGYELLLEGESETGKTLAAARLAGIPALQATAAGDVQSDLQIRGAWPGWGSGPQNFIAPQITGTAKLRNLRITLRGTQAPVEVLSADMRLLPDSVRVEKLNAKAANSMWTGSLEMPRGCGAPSQCEIHFNLRSNQAAMSDLSAWLRSSPKARPWYRVLEPSTAVPSFFANLRASGQIAAEHLQIHGVAATHVAARLALGSGKLTMTDMRANLLGGMYRGEWQTDFGVAPPVSISSGTISGVSLSDMAQQMMKDSWITGTASGTYQLTANGDRATEFWQSAEGSLHFEARDGVLPHMALETPEELKFALFSGQVRLRAREIEIRNAKLESEAGAFELSGTASSTRELQFKLLRAAGGAAGYAISGTLAQPRVSPLSNSEQAKLKR